MAVEGLLNLLANLELALNAANTVTGRGKYEIHPHPVTMLL